MSRLEVAIENSFGNWLNTMYPEWEYLKFTVLGTAGYPDRILLGPGRRTLFIEWKQLGKKLEPLQAERKTELEAIGHRVEVCDHIETAKETFRSYLRAEGLPVRSD